MRGPLGKGACRKPRGQKRGSRPLYRRTRIRPDGDHGADFVPIGWAVRLASVQSLAHAFRVNSDVACNLLTRLRVPLIQMGQTAYFNVPALEARLYYLLRPGRKDIIRRRTQPSGLAGLLEGSRFRQEWQAVARLYYDLSKEQTRKRLQEAANLLRQGLKHIRFTR
jgi:hypothetical protein